MNGLNERNHCVTDRILEKMLVDQPKLPLEVALCWANMAKNSLQMHHGFSSYQLVLGANPRLPNVVYDKLPALEGVTTSETVLMHLQGLHTARKEFIASESSERIRRALRHKVRVSERAYKHGEKVYYKRDGDKWKGPATVIGNDGKTYFLRHGAFVIRVAVNRLIGVEDSECAPANLNSPSLSQQIGDNPDVSASSSVVDSPCGNSTVDDADADGDLLCSPL